MVKNKVLPITNTNFHWIQLRKEFFNLHNDIFICKLYYPPSFSAHLSDDNDSESFQLNQRETLKARKLQEMSLRTRGPQLTHLSETATADMQMACNIFLILL